MWISIMEANKPFTTELCESKIERTLVRHASTLRTDALT